MQPRVHYATVAQKYALDTQKGVGMAETFSPREAADYIGWPVETLKRWRTVGTGPVYVKAGRRVRYRKASLDRWMEAREREGAARGGRSA
jgi:excisionase family DNA binding protein